MRQDGSPLTADGRRNVVVDAATGRSTRWCDLAAPDSEAPLVAAVDTSFAALPYVWAHARSATELLVVADARLDAPMRAELSSAGFDIAGADGVQRATVGRTRDPGRLWLLTSGSTGRPKRIGHTLASLTTVNRAQTPRRWLCPYSPGTYAWWQLVTLGLMQPGQDLVIVDPSELDTWGEVAAKFQVDAVSGTPTFWRQSLMRDRDQLAQVPLAQITLGGEPVDQAILDQLATVFPRARLSWIYASSEVGASVVVHDGKAGFPVEWLDRDSAGTTTLSVIDDELVVGSRHQGLGIEGAVRTGDRVVIEDGRVHIVGRVDRDEINVGGMKVSASAVRDVLLSHPDVAWASVTGRKAPVVGQVVTAQVVPRISDDTRELSTDLGRWCGRHLPEHGVPRRIRLLDQIPTKETLKSDV